MVFLVKYKNICFLNLNYLYYIMGCSKCKNKNEIKDEFMAKANFFEKVGIAILAILLILSSYGIYSLIQKVI
jgi:hypothetical protein